MLTERVEWRVGVVRDRESLILMPAGEIDLGSFKELRSAIAQARVLSYEHLVVDLQEVTFIDSTGLHAIWEEHVRALGVGETFAIANPAGPVLRVLELTGLSKRLRHVELPPRRVRRSRRIREAWLRSLRPGGGSGTTTTPP